MLDLQHISISTQLFSCNFQNSAFDRILQMLNVRVSAILCRSVNKFAEMLLNIFEVHPNVIDVSQNSTEFRREITSRLLDVAAKFQERCRKIQCFSFFLSSFLYNRRPRKFKCRPSFSENLPRNPSNKLVKS